MNSLTLKFKIFSKFYHSLTIDTVSKNTPAHVVKSEYLPFLTNTTANFINLYLTIRKWKNYYFDINHVVLSAYSTINYTFADHS